MLSFYAPRLRVALLYFCFVLTFSAAMIAGPQIASAQLSVVPTRVVFEGRDRGAQVNLLNMSNRTEMYRIGWIYYRMTESDGYQRLAERPDDMLDFSDVVVYSPRQVTIPPNGRQSIRLSLRRPPNLPDGEYRAHLLFERLPHEGERSPASGGNAGGIGLHAIVTYGISIPVVIRQGAYNAAGEITGARFVPPMRAGDDPKLEIDVARLGHSSLFSRLQAWHVRPDGQEVEIGRLINVNIFPEIDRRSFQMSLNVPEVRGGAVKIALYSEERKSATPIHQLLIPVGQ